MQNQSCFPYYIYWTRGHQGMIRRIIKVSEFFASGASKKRVKHPMKSEKFTLGTPVDARNVHKGVEKHDSYVVYHEIWGFKAAWLHPKTWRKIVPI